MNYLYWISVFMSVIAYGILSAHNYKNGPNGKSFWLYAFFLISAIYLSAKVFIPIKATIITAAVLVIGNLLFWQAVWFLISKKNPKNN